MERPALRVQRHAARHVCDAPLCGRTSKHFTCPLVALRFEGTFHVFANVLAKTFHFCAVGISHMFVYDDNYAGQTSIRVRRRVMDLRADLDKGAAGNTCCIVKAHLCKGVRKDALYCVPA